MSMEGGNGSTAGGGAAGFGPRTHVRAAGEEEPGNVDMAGKTRPVQRGPALLIGKVDIRPVPVGEE